MFLVSESGHAAGNFMPGEGNGTIMKKSDDKERYCLRKLMDDPLRDYVPEFRREVEHKGESMCSLHACRGKCKECQG